MHPCTCHSSCLAIVDRPSCHLYACRTRRDRSARSHRVQRTEPGLDQEVHTDPIIKRVPNKPRKMRSPIPRREYKRPRHKRRQALHNRSRQATRAKVLEIHAVCTCPIANIVLCLECLLLTCAKAGLALASRQTVPSMKPNESSMQHRHAKSSRSSKSTAFSPKQHSRPGPKSGVRHWLHQILMLMLIARPHGVRVPTQAAWVGESNTHMHNRPSQEVKHCGVQLSNV